MFHPAVLQFLLFPFLAGWIISPCEGNDVNKYARRLICLHTTRIIDGDTFEGRANDSTFRIRLNAIDAPERGQGYYQVSKKRLGDLCEDGPLDVTLISKDRYGRWIADVSNQSNIFINQQLVKEGMAWVYRKYSRDTTLVALENKARVERKGLWNENNPVAPWLKRK